MNYLLMFFIRVYWCLPKRYRRKCLFKESCSRHVYFVTRRDGFKKGINALQKRWRQCRPGYAVYIGPEGKEQVVLRDGYMVQRSDTTL